MRRLLPASAKNRKLNKKTNKVNKTILWVLQAFAKKQKTKQKNKQTQQNNAKALTSL